MEILFFMASSISAWMMYNNSLVLSTSTKGAKDKSRAPPNSSAPAASRALTATIESVVGDSSNNSLDGKNAPRLAEAVVLSGILPSPRMALECIYGRSIRDP
ncbi:hypothetical protein V6N13_138819 [Hibiscus sabdariffa]